MSPNRTAQVLGGLGLAAVAGFTGSLLRRRPPTIYTAGLRSTADHDVRVDRAESPAPLSADRLPNQRSAGRDQAGGAP